MLESTILSANAAYVLEILLILCKMNVVLDSAINASEKRIRGLFSVKNGKLSKRQHKMVSFRLCNCLLSDLWLNGLCINPARESGRGIIPQSLVCFRATNSIYTFQAPRLHSLITFLVMFMHFFLIPAN